MATDATPVACSLGADDVANRIEEWHTVLAHVTGRMPIERGLRLAFGADPPIADLARLAVAEHDCCRFFTFAITVDERGVALEVRAPEEGDAILESVFGGAA
jgi:hypothetical protein